jgi:hypothetical protein
VGIPLSTGTSLANGEVIPVAGPATGEQPKVQAPTLTIRVKKNNRIGTASAEFDSTFTAPCDV